MKSPERAHFTAAYETIDKLVLHSFVWEYLPLEIVHDSWFEKWLADKTWAKVEDQSVSYFLDDRIFNTATETDRSSLSDIKSFDVEVNTEVLHDLKYNFDSIPESVRKYFPVLSK